MSREFFERSKLVELYDNWKDSIERDQHELKTRHFDEDGKVKDVNDPSMNQFAGKIAGKTEFALELANFIEATEVPDTLEGIDEA